MSFINADIIYELTMREIAGDITAAEKERLNRLIEESPEGYALRQELHELFTPQLLQEMKAGMTAPADIIQSAERRITDRYVRRAAVIAATILLLVAGIYHFSRPTQRLLSSDQLYISDTAVSMKQPSTPPASSPDRHKAPSKKASGSSNYPVLDSIRQCGCGMDSINNASFFTERPPDPGFHNVSWNIINTKIGRISSLQLPDCTLVSMNAASSLRYPQPFSSNSRDIYIRGEVYFNVASDAQRPFTVHLPDKNRISVLGTVFNVNAYSPDSVKIALFKGAITVTTDDKTITLTPGNELLCSNGTAVRLQPFNSMDVLSWQQRYYRFQHATLEEISNVIHRWYDVTIQFENSGIKEQRYSGIIRFNKPLTDFLETVVNMSPDLIYSIEDKKIYFRRKTERLK